MKRRQTLTSLLALLAACVLCAAAGADVTVNEIMASTAIVTNGQDYDWIELYNSGDAPVNLAGWSLSDDPKDPGTWVFPAGTAIPAKGYLVVYCAGDAQTVARRGELFADFKLSSRGEDVCLTDKDGFTTTVRFGPQYGNVSFGVPRDAMAWGFLETPTPGAQNPGVCYEQRAAEPTITPEAGFYQESVEVAIVSPQGAQVRYTTDGSEPTRASALYAGPITLRKTAVVRARAFGDELLGSQSVGGTYFIDDPSPVPVVSVYTDRELLYGETKGLFVRGSGATPNYKQDWEYAAGMEYFDENGTRREAQACTIRVTGNTSRDEKQKSFTLYARAAFNAGNFDYPFFEDRDYASYAALLLRSGGSDARFCRLRDEVFSQLSEGLDLYNQAARPVLVYINGAYAGHYNLREKPNRDSLAQWEGITSQGVVDAADILESTGMSGDQVIQGDNADWIALMRFCRDNDLNQPDNLRHVLDQLDVNSLFNYAIFNMVIGNSDADNVRVYRFPGEKWKFLLHDVEAGCTNDAEAPVGSILRPKSASPGVYPHWPLAALLEVPEYRDLFLRRVSEIVISHFLYDQQVEPVFLQWQAALAPLIPRHTDIYKALSYSEWTANVRAAMFYARVRPKKVLGYIAARLGLEEAEEQAYFGSALALLAAHNAPK